MQKAVTEPSVAMIVAHACGHITNTCHADTLAVQALRQSKHNPGKHGPTVVTKRYRALGATDYDVCIAGGTLGVFLALALQVGRLQPSQCLPGQSLHCRGATERAG